MASEDMLRIWGIVFSYVGDPSIHDWPAFTFSWRILVGSIIAVIGATLANSAGVGGGGLFVPMFRLFIGFDVKTSAALSKSMIMGGAVASAVYNSRLKHPVLDKPLIDYDLALLIQPMLLLGISIGVMCNVMFPDWVLTLLLMIVLIGMTYKSFMKGICTWKQENQLACCTSEEEENRDVDVPPTLPCCSNSDESNTLEEGLLRDDEEYGFSWELVRWTNIVFLCLVWLIYLAIQVVKSLDTECGSVYWILLNVLQIPVSVIATGFGTWRLRRRTSAKGICVWSFQQVAAYPLYAVVAGIIGGLLGIGGGMVLAPLFLDLGIIPQVTSATTTFIVVFSSSMSVVEFYLLGRLPVNYAVYFTLLCAVSAVVGLHIMKMFVRRYGRSSVIIFILAFIIGASAVTLGVIGGISDVAKFMSGEYMGFHDLCI